METNTHSLDSLFSQLGLDSSTQAIENFIAKHKPLSGEVELHNANFWTPSQAAFLKQAKEEDADWADIVDQLNVLLH